MACNRVGQHRQYVGVAPRIARPNHGHVLAVALAQGHLVDAQGFQRGERGPVHRRRQTMVHDPFHRLDPQIELPADIGHRAVDQSLQDLLLERRGVRAVRVVPGAALSRGRPTRTVRTAVALGPDLDEDLTTESRPVSQPDRSVETVKPVNFAATAVTLGGSQGAFHLDQQRAILQHAAG